jgi:hypothetical protein
MEGSKYFSLYTFIFNLTTHMLYVGITSIGEKNSLCSLHFHK